MIIAHRGNANGPNPAEENRPDIIDLVYHKYQFHSEIDLWKNDDGLWLGHDFPEHKIDIGWLHIRSNLLWIHCKNVEALAMLQDHAYHKDFNYFWHEEDAYTLTSKGWIWAYPGKKLDKKTNKSIAVMPEITDMPFKELKNFTGVCTDWGSNYIK